MSYASIYDPDQDFDRWHTIATAEKVRTRIRPGDRVLELGCATGLMTNEVVAAGATVVAVDRSAAYLDRARARGLAGVVWIEDDITTVDVSGPFDHVISTNVVHELEDPATFLRRCGQLVRPGGLVHVSLQNPRSLHRLVGVEMGLIAALDEVSERGQQFDTLQLMSREDLELLGRAAGLRPVGWEGVLLKPLPNRLMDQLPADVLRGFVAAARHLPEFASMYYVLFEPEVVGR